MHQRQVICDKVVDLLVAGATVAGARVYPNRFLPLRTKGAKDELPAILVYTLSETSDDEDTAPRELTRKLELAIDGIVAVESDADAALNALALEIETVMHADPYLDETAGDSLLTDTDLGVEPDGDRLLGRVALTYEVTYRTLAPEPTADEDMDDFETVEATYKTDGVDQSDDDDAEDVFTVEEEA